MTIQFFKSNSHNAAGAFCNILNNGIQLIVGFVDSQMTWLICLSPPADGGGCR